MIFQRITPLLQVRMNSHLPPRQLRNLGLWNVHTLRSISATGRSKFYNGQTMASAITQ